MEQPNRPKRLRASSGIATTDEVRTLQKGQDMTRKDYEAMASALRETYKQAELKSEVILIERLIVQITHLYTQENERFDEEKFLAAVFA